MMAGLGLRLGGALLVAAGIYFAGHHAGTTACEADHLRAEKAARDEADRLASVAGADETRAAAQTEQRRETEREIASHVPTIIERPVYRSGCIDAGGMRLIARAVDAANGDPAGGPDGPASALPPSAGER